MREPVRLVLDDHLAGLLSSALKLEGFFPEFRADHVSKLFPRSALFAYEHGHHLLEQGETGRDIFIIYDGRVDISQSFGSAGACLASLGEGDILGEIALLQDGVRSATAVVVGQAKVFRLAFDDVQYILTNNAELAAHLRALAKARLGLS